MMQLIRCQAACQGWKQGILGPQPAAQSLGPQNLPQYNAQEQEVSDGDHRVFRRKQKELVQVRLSCLITCFIAEKGVGAGARKGPLISLGNKQLLVLLDRCILPSPQPALPLLAGAASGLCAMMRGNAC